MLKRYEDDGRLSSDRTFVDLAAMNGLYRFQEALRGVVDNFPVAAARWAMRLAVFPLGAHYRPAPDALSHRAVKLLLEVPEARDRLTRYIYVSKDADDPTGLLEVALKKAVAPRRRKRSWSALSGQERSAAITASTGSARPSRRASSPRARASSCGSSKRLRRA